MAWWGWIISSDATLPNVAQRLLKLKSRSSLEPAILYSFWQNDIPQILSELSVRLKRISIPWPLRMPRKSFHERDTANASRVAERRLYFRNWYGCKRLLFLALLFLGAKYNLFSLVKARHTLVLRILSLLSEIRLPSLSIRLNTKWQWGCFVSWCRAMIYWVLRIPICSIHFLAISTNSASPSSLSGKRLMSCEEKASDTCFTGLFTFGRMDACIWKESAMALLLMAQTPSCAKSVALFFLFFWSLA